MLGVCASEANLDLDHWSLPDASASRAWMKKISQNRQFLFLQYDQKPSSICFPRLIEAPPITSCCFCSYWSPYLLSDIVLDQDRTTGRSSAEASHGVPVHEFWLVLDLAQSHVPRLSHTCSDSSIDLILECIVHAKQPRQENPKENWKQTRLFPVAK